MKRPPLSLKAQALALLGRREHSRSELRTKLIEHVIKRQQFEAEQQQKLSDNSPSWQNDPFHGDPFGENEDTRSHLQKSPPSGYRRSSSARDEALSSEAVAEVESVLDWLQTQRYQSDARFVETRVNSRAGRWGQARIQQELQRHGVELDDETAQQLKDTELSRARDVWLRRFHGHPPQDPKERARHMRFLASRGFRTDIIFRVLEGSDADNASTD